MRNHLSKAVTIVLKKRHGVKPNTRYFLFFIHTSRIISTNVHALSKKLITTARIKE